MEERYTLITGGSEGIGLELAKLFAKEGNNLVIVARDVDKLLEVKKELENEYKVKVKTFGIDFFVDNACEKLYKFVDENFLVVDKLINCAGMGSFGEFVNGEEGIEEKIIKLNISVLTDITKHFLKKMIQDKKGSILNVASTAAFTAGPKMAMYYSSKAYVLSLSEALYEEAKGYGVYVGCLCPGPVRTRFQEKAKIHKSEKANKFLMEADKVAQIAYKGFYKRKAIIITGNKNKLLIWGNKLIPRSLSRKIILKNNK